MPTPLVIGHACAGGEAPHNTLAGVRACLAAGAQGMEIDVRLSADGIPVLMHDSTVDRTTNYVGPVSSFSADELSKMDAGDGERVPTLREVLDLVQGRLTVMCELKPFDGVQEERLQYNSDLVTAVIRACDPWDAQGWIAAHSFDRWLVQDWRSRNGCAAGALISPAVEPARWRELFERALFANVQAVSVQHGSVTEDLVLAARKQHLSVLAWTPDDEGEWSRLCEAGVDGIITNYPTRLTRFLASRS
jgi:glycerophosphoryl diester phosphodiesterase